MDSFNVPTEEPSIIFPVGAILEDMKAKYKVLEPMVRQDKAHKYKVEVLEEKQAIPKHLLPFYDPKQHWIMVLPQNLHLIKRLDG